MRKPALARYRTTNWSEYNAGLRRRGSLLVWLDREMEWAAPKRGRPGRPQTFSDAAIQFCLHQSPIRLGVTADDWDGGEPSRAGGPGLAGAGLFHPVTAAE